MEPCPFVRLIVESLALKPPPPLSKPADAGVHPSSTPCFCIVQLHDFPSSSPQSIPIPLASSGSPPESAVSPAVVFTLDPASVYCLASKPACLTLTVYTGRAGTTCGFRPGRVLVGRVRLAVELTAEAAAARQAVLRSGWVDVGGGGRSPALLHLVVRLEPDPRYVFQFGGEPECSPVVFQVAGGAGCRKHSGCLRQPAFSCRFSADRRRSTRSSSLPPVTSNRRRLKSFLLPSLVGDRASRLRRDQRKGWTVTIHDHSGSPVAAASMITPFVPSPGSDIVSRTNPGAWLILQPAAPFSGIWKPWGRLEAWRERGAVDSLGYRFELILESGTVGSGSIAIVESSISFRNGGEFLIDAGATAATAARGFVMSSTVEAEGKASLPEVRLGAYHVACMGDAALFVALAAAVDLSMDACQLFSRKLRKELCGHDDQE
ncbi:hypothetical protein AXF42_Ash009447 [Apostasia shenzhenica]|uniref:Formin-like protein 18 n=1 Tax=Apostasia shenzhenica TaxID=1088818 RepID=A0A2I0B8V6_9ASPA|nr:hypothetical protein AXF42_Ash009447 [Apostasia shenzhenica]